MAYDRYQDAVLATGLPRHHDELLYRAAAGGYQALCELARRLA
jgi:hypothetical protein